MARVFDRAVANEARDDDDGVGGGRSAIRLLAAAITALVVSFLVVARSQGAVSGGSARSGSELSAGGVTVTDDDSGHSLFQVPAMAPGKPVSNCIGVTYAGTVVPAVVRLSAQADGALAPALDVTVDEGDGGRFGDCGGFRSSRTVFHGTLAQLAERAPTDAFRPAAAQETHGFRITFSLADTGVQQGAAAKTDLLWTASAGG